MNEMNTMLSRPVSRRTAIKAAVAAGAAAYAIPALETISGSSVAHAAGGVSQYGTHLPFVITCPSGGNVAYNYTTPGLGIPGSGTISLRPNATCNGLIAGLVDNTGAPNPATGYSSANAKLNLVGEAANSTPVVGGSPGQETVNVTFTAADTNPNTPSGGSCQVTISNVIFGCQAGAPAQTITIICSASGGSVVYFEVTGTVNGQIALTRCP